MYTLYNTSVELNTRLATAPQPVFHCNTLLASLAINSSLPPLPTLLLVIKPGNRPVEKTALTLFSGQPFPSNAFFLSCLSSRYQVTSTPQAYMSQYVCVSWNLFYSSVGLIFPWYVTNEIWPPICRGITVTSCAEDILYLQPIQKLNDGNPITGLALGKAGTLPKGITALIGTGLNDLAQQSS
jgi:hypothetical protein